MMKQMLSYIAILALVIVAGCASKFDSEVARFHKLPQPSGETFQIQPMDATKQGSLEFEQYATMVGNRLVAEGYRATPAGTKPDLIVKLDYGVDDGHVEVRSYPRTGFSGYPYGYWGRGFYDPFYYPYYMGPYGYDSDIQSYLVYTRRMKMDIERAPKVPGQNPEVLFEGRVESEGRDNRLPEVMPYMVKAMFKNFPGASGITQHVVIEKDKGGY